MKAAIAFVACLFAAAHADTITTTTTPESSTTTTTPIYYGTTTPNTGTAFHYGQCAGLAFTGPTVCASPYICTYSNPWFSQCL